MYCPPSILKGSCRIIVNCTGLFSSLPGYLKTSPTLGNPLLLARTTIPLQYSRSTPSYTEVVIKIPKEM